jgi:hypothetical protein
MARRLSPITVAASRFINAGLPANEAAASLECPAT